MARRKRDLSPLNIQIPTFLKKKLSEEADKRFTSQTEIVNVALIKELKINIA